MTGLATVVRARIFVDASNVFISFADLFDQKAQLLEVDWPKFGDYLSNLAGGTEWQIMYFVGVPLENDQLARVDEPRRSEAMFDAVRAANGEVYPGLLMRFDSASRRPGDAAHREKMVDTGAATMIADGAAAKEYDVGIVLSADMDFVPPVSNAATARETPMHVFYVSELSLSGETRRQYESINRVVLHSLGDDLHRFVKQVRIMPQRVSLPYDLFAMWAAIWNAQHTRGLRQVQDVELEYLLGTAEFPGLTPDRDKRYELIRQLHKAALIESYPIPPSNLTGIRIAQKTEQFAVQ